jgi:hypothetical protein
MTQICGVLGLAGRKGSWNGIPCTEYSRCRHVEVEIAKICSGDTGKQFGRCLASGLVSGNYWMNDSCVRPGHQPV